MAEENDRQQNGILANPHRNGDAEVVARNLRTISCDMRLLNMMFMETHTVCLKDGESGPDR